MYLRDMRVRECLALAGVLALSVSVACGKKAPTEVQAAIDAQHAAAIKVASEAAALCPAVKGSAPFQANPLAAPSPPPNPAKGTALESDKSVVDVFVMCSWPDPRDAKGAIWAGTGLHSLKGTSNVQTKPVTMPEDISADTCKKDAHNCERTVVPSRYSTSARSADLLVVRPTPDGGQVEVTVVIALPATAASATTASTTAAARPGSPTCALAQEIATSWCERRLQGCKESPMTTDQCKDAFLKYTAVGACKGTDADKKACLAAVAALPCESFKVTGSSVPGACTTALQ